jgi:hypothetical protein
MLLSALDSAKTEKQPLRKRLFNKLPPFSAN